MTGPNLASTATGGTSPQPFDLTVLANFKAYLFAGNTTPPTTDDALLQRMITSASAMIQDFLGYDVQNGVMLAATPYTETKDSVYDGSGWPSAWIYQIPVRWSPIVSVSSVTIDGVTVPSGGDGVQYPGWFLDPTDPVQIQVAGYRPNPRAKKNVVVSYVGGYSLIPYDLEQATIELIALRYKEINRLGIRSISMAGESTSYNIGALPDSTRMAISSYRRVVLG
jgi:hypothetical protein